ncbi:Hypothetical predicted protein [Paramuricea clavata]|uniref:Uncharacterized protein n=1 Tax=Paramuricea clavata TaxID=317549 RepID=A0A7D9L5G2_PARCT|nr:Hypothetical predicted protein [Paramuricea clavata]
MFRLCLALIFLISLIKIYESSVVVPFNDCGSKSTTVKQLNFDCDEGIPEPCSFLKGKTYHGRISFTTKAEVPKGVIVLHAIIGSATLPFPFTKSDLCSDHNLTCPIASGASEVLTIELAVPSFAPATDLLAQFEVKPSSGSKTDIMCVEFLAQIKDSNDIAV